MKRRAFLALLAAPALLRAADDAPVRPGRRFEFPRDHGSHPEFRLEWWYVTGWLDVPRSSPLGFQITFFRLRTRHPRENPSRLAPFQIYAAHAALADPAFARLRWDERAARAALGLAGAAQTHGEVWLDGWRLEEREGRWRAQVAARAFAFDLELRAPGPPVLQGDAGYSRKGHRPEEASYYYSQPQLTTRGVVEWGGRRAETAGVAWLDHEWSSTLLAPEAVGWDWCGLNLIDGRALMAFRIRGRDGGTWYAPPGVRFEPLRRWRSPRTGVEYPVAMRVEAAGERYDLAPLIDDQELDARASTGTLYWEGAVRVRAGAREVGRGYLELTGYGRPLRI